VALLWQRLREHVFLHETVPEDFYTALRITFIHSKLQKGKGIRPVPPNFSQHPNQVEFDESALSLFDVGLKPLHLNGVNKQVINAVLQEVSPNGTLMSTSELLQLMKEPKQEYPVDAPVVEDISVSLQPLISNNKLSSESKRPSNDAVFKRQTSNQKLLSASRSSSAAKTRQALPAVGATVDKVEPSIEGEEKMAANFGELNSTSKSKRPNDDAVFKRQTSNQKFLSASRSDSAAKTRKAMPTFVAAVDRNHDEFETQSVSSQLSLRASDSAAETSANPITRRNKKAAQVTHPAASIELI